MNCPRRNILQNGNFQKGLAPWRGRNIRLVANPVVSGDVSMEIENGGLLYQYIPGTFRRDCGYYLHFRIFNNRRTPKPPRVFASVAGLDQRKRLLRTTPVLVEPPYTREPHFTSYVTIVPPPPVGTKYLAVIFQVHKGLVLVDYVSVSAQDI